MKVSLRLYVPTRLEKWVSDWYMGMKIFEPHEIDEYIISEHEGILLIEKPLPSHSFSDEHVKIICIDSRESSTKRREQFFHEMCHVLRHEGSQTKLHSGFRLLQEADAENFSKYAAIPIHMLEKIDFREPYIVDLVSEIFSVSFELAEMRLRQIKNNILTKVSIIA